ncbi:NAD(P)-binding domain-containing protein [Pseudochelatococcus contaminans]|uniref:Cation diffusion facilitator CzcD-associated flavoprotein CzcO n=1 Tax=Pseudochelatococcus contaminans TaxID=1538103 RepID=A0A7W5Z5M8_9HYPH|nr:NAD(P)-binding domain-containing protein [Pseudochelatococcus contaminans]MBB3810449.1 cation diffusion facilitator CzcD-associated flavoprotein CzcO [Pseudochelatococcus contaminans]
MSRLDLLNEQVRRIFDYQDIKVADWVTAREGVDHNVLIVGGGQSGLSLAFALARAGIGKVSVVDAHAKGQAGIWKRTARMRTLRTLKTLVGPDIGLTALSFPSWYEAVHGEGAFQDVARIPRLEWDAYLQWFAERTQIDVRHGVRVVGVEPAGDALRVHLDIDGTPAVEITRKLVLASGIDSLGGAFIPPIISGSLPQSLYRHTSEEIDYKALAGKKVGVIGAASSAFDAAAEALEAGAEAVHVLSRRAEVPALSILRQRGYPGVADRFHLLPDALRWTLVNTVLRAGSPPPADSITRATVFPNFHLHLGAELTDVSVNDGRIQARVNDEAFTFDFVIAGTGFVQRPATAPALSAIADDIALWRDRYTPPAGEENEALLDYPYLGTGFEFTEKEPGTAPYVGSIFCYTNAAQLSFGRLIGDIPTIKWGIPHLANAIGDSLFFEDQQDHVRRITAPVAAPDFTRDVYASSVWNNRASAASEDKEQLAVT